MKQLLFYLVLLSFSYALFAQADELQNIQMESFGYYYSHQYTEATAGFEKISEIGSLSSQELLCLGISAYKSNQQGIAEKALNAAAMHEPQAWLWLAKIAALYQQNELACRQLYNYLTECAGANPDSLIRDTSFMRMNKSDAWFNLWQNDWSATTFGIIRESSYQAGHQNFEMAHQLLDNRKFQLSDKANVLAANANVFYIEGNWQLAINEINQAIELETKNSNYKDQKADYLLALGNTSEAYALLSQLEEAEPWNYSRRYKLAEIALAMGEMEEAYHHISLYLKYVQKSEANYLAARIYYENGYYSDALRSYSILLGSDKSNPEFFVGRGLAYLKTSLYDFAAKDFSMGLDLDPNNGETNFYMAQAELGRGNREMACYYWTRARNFNYLPATDYLYKHCGK